MRKTRSFFIFAAAGLLAVRAISAGEGEAKPETATHKGLPALQVKVIDKAPAVDGKLDDEAWKNAPVLLLTWSDGRGGKPLHDTEARVLTTKDALYLGVRCKETDLKSIKANQQARDADEVWQEDCVEFFLALTDSDDSTYHQIVVNAAGSMYDGYDRDTAWNAANVKAAAGKEEAAWVVELCVPFADLKLPEKKEDLAKGCRMNIYRERPRDDGASNDYAWSSTGGSNHTPNKFGWVFFEAYGAKLPPPEKPDEAKTEGAPAEKKE